MSGSGAAIASRLQPIGVRSYLDVVQVRLEHGLTDAELKFIKAQTGRWPRVRYRRPRWAARPELVWLVRIFEANDTVLHWLANRTDTHLNYVEFARDFFFSARSENTEAYAFFCRHALKTHHRDQGIRFFKETRYTGKRGVRMNLVIYPDLPSRKSKHRHCVHIEMRINRAETLRRVNISSVIDLIRFDFDAFFHQWLRLSDIDLKRFGKAYRKYTERRGEQPLKTAARRSLRRKTFAYDPNIRAGGLLWHLFGSVQLMMDNFGNIPNARRTLRPIDISNWS